MDIKPITLTGQVIRLEPLSEAHVPGLTKAGQYESIWKYMLYGMVTNQEKMHQWVMDRLERQAQGSELPFAVVHLKSGNIIGSTRFMEIVPKYRRVEIGGTWYTPAFQRTAANSESKYLLLGHAFETWNCIRVQFKTDQRNVRSQLALERIGAVKEGVFRNHMITPEGSIRNSVYYSIVDSEWPEVKTRLEEMLKGK
jgi:RimJ/RimL family protein N-acetyltransferase